MIISGEERETTIQWADADKGMAHVFSCQRPMMRRLSKNPQAKVVATHKAPDGTITGLEFEIPVRCIVSVRSGRRRVISDAQRAAASQRLAAGRARKLVGDVRRV